MEVERIFRFILFSLLNTKLLCELSARNMLKYRDSVELLSAVCDAMQCPLSPKVSASSSEHKPFTIYYRIQELPQSLSLPKNPKWKRCGFGWPVTRSGSRTTTAYLSRTLKEL